MSERVQMNKENHGRKKKEMVHLRLILPPQNRTGAGLIERPLMLPF